MFGLIRRISHSVIPRPDRPWEDDPTSNAPNTRRKRRLSSTERDANHGMDEENARKKKLRGDSEIMRNNDTTDTTPEVNGDAGIAVTKTEDNNTSEEVTVQREGSLEVKVVTEGVKEVELEDKQPDSASEPSTAVSDEQDSKEDTPTEDAVAEKEDSASTEGEETVDTTATVHPEAIPLPDEQAGELDDIRSSSPPEEEPTKEPVVVVETTKHKETDNDTPPAISDGPRLPRSAQRNLRSSSPRKVARV